MVTTSRSWFTYGPANDDMTTLFARLGAWERLSTVASGALTAGALVLAVATIARLATGAARRFFV